MARQVRGLAIVSIGSCIKRINKLHYKVKSQSSEETWYDVIRLNHRQSESIIGFMKSFFPEV